ncbi:hypothetical protein NQ318_019238, partial [Aromia moschata]
MSKKKSSTDLSYEDFAEICRVCLSYGELQPFNINLLDIYRYLIKVEDEMNYIFPQNICKICTKQLEDISTFIDNCKNTEETLKVIYLDRNFKKYLSDNSDTDYDIEDNFDTFESNVETENKVLYDKKNRAVKEELQSDYDKKTKTKKELRRELKKIRNQANPLPCNICNK